MYFALPDSAVLCKDCFEQDLIKKLGTPASTGGLWETLTEAALAGLLPLSGERLTFDNMTIDLPEALTAAFGLEARNTEVLLIGVDGNGSAAVRYGPIQRKGGRVILPAAEKRIDEEV
jgi:hypothetical protein